MSLPLMWAQMVDAQRERPRDTKSLRLCISAGDVCPQQTEHAVEKTFGLPLLSYWAATEEPYGARPWSRPGPFFRLSPGTEFDVVADGGADVDPHKTGELVTKSPGTAIGYWRSPGHIDPLPDGRFTSGDLVRCEDDHFRYMGRIKDLIVSGGSNVSPVEVEHVLRGQTGIKDVAVAGVSDEKLGQRLVAVFVLEDGAPKDAPDNALQKASEALADYKVPKMHLIVDAIPKTALGKTDRTDVAAIFGSPGPDPSV